jgi:hypothetical protein
MKYTDCLMVVGLLIAVIGSDYKLQSSGYYKPSRSMSSGITSTKTRSGVFVMARCCEDHD